MGYSNTSTPRFYVSVLQWLKAIGKIHYRDSAFYYEGNFVDLLDINPSHQMTIEPDLTTPGHNDTIRYTSDAGQFQYLMYQKQNFMMVLGHNFGSTNASIYFSEGEGTPPHYCQLDGSTYYDYGDEFNTEELCEAAGGTWKSTWSAAATSDVINFGGTSQGAGCPYNGFTLSTGNNSDNIATGEIQFRMDYQGDGDVYNNMPLKIGSLLYGNYYDMPHSPELKLTMTREMDGVKRIRTRGGADLVKHQYIKPPLWGSLAPWELSAPGSATNQALSRVGRRTWSLSFNAMHDSDMYPMSELTSGAILDNLDGEYETYPYGNDYSTSVEYPWGVIDATANNILRGNSFYAMVVHKTQGGRLPFVFNPSGGGSDPDNNLQNFAICKFDQSSFKFKQISNKIYQFSCRIKEVW